VTQVLPLSIKIQAYPAVRAYECSIQSKIISKAIALLVGWHQEVSPLAGKYNMIYHSSGQYYNTIAQVSQTKSSQKRSCNSSGN